MPESESVTFHIRSLADTQEKRTKGLMFAKPLNETEVMFFIFPYVGNYGFWNKNVSFGLTLVFVDENGKIVGFGDLEPEQTESVGSDFSEVKYVIEAQQGIFKKLGIKVGDLVIYDKDKLRIKKMY